MRVSSRARRCDSSSETFRLTVVSGAPRRRPAAERLPASTAVIRISIDSRRSISHSKNRKIDFYSYRLLIVHGRLYFSVGRPTARWPYGELPMSCIPTHEAIDAVPTASHPVLEGVTKQLGLVSKTQCFRTWVRRWDRRQKSGLCSALRWSKIQAKPSLDPGAPRRHYAPPCAALVIDCCITNVLSFRLEVCDATNRKPRGAGAPTLAGVGDAQGRTVAIGSSATRWRGSPQRSAVEGGSATTRRSWSTREASARTATQTHG